jgi:hypothetical protein
MTTTPIADEELLRRQTSRILGQISLGLFAVFLVSVVAALLPPRPLDPLWQLQSINGLLQASVFPLLAMALLFMAAVVSGSERAGQRLSKARRFCVPVSLAFLFLLPLQVSAQLRLGIRSDIPLDRRIGDLTQIRAAAQASQSLPELAEALRRLPGSPTLPPGFNRPVAQFRAEVVQQISSDLEDLRQRRRGQQLQRRLAQLGVFLRSGSLILVFAVLFASIGGRTLRLPWQGGRPAEKRDASEKGRGSRSETLEVMLREAPTMRRPRGIRSWFS